MPNISAVVALLEQHRAPVACQCGCCVEIVRVAADLIDQVALEQAEVVRARIAGIAQSLRESGVVLHSVDIPRSERTVLLGCAGLN